MILEEQETSSLRGRMMQEQKGDSYWKDLNEFIESAWRSALVLSPEAFPGVVFERNRDPLTGEAREKLDEFFLHLGIRGVVFGHEGFPINISNELIGVDSDNVEPGSVQLGKNGLEFDSYVSGVGRVPLMSMEEIKKEIDASVLRLGNQLIALDDKAESVGGINLEKTEDSLQIRAAEPGSINISNADFERFQAIEGFRPGIVEVSSREDVGITWGIATGSSQNVPVGQ
jgi:hypothetical protein